MAGDRAALIDVIVPIHDPARSLERTLSSLRKSTALRVGTDLAVTVVCHNLPAEDIRATLSSDASDAVSFLELHDGIYSPAGPKNFGFAKTDSRYVSFIDSDDYLEPGALDAWLKLAESEALAAVIPVERHSDGRLIRTPPTRPWRRRSLNGVRDRLAYRTAPLGLLRREALDRLGLAFTAGLATGEDQQFTAKLWFSAERVAYARHAPAYVVGDDASGRVTLATRSMDEELRGAATLLSSDWFLGRTLADRRSIAIKTVRVHVFGASLAASRGVPWVPADRLYLSEFLAELDAVAAGYERPFSLADRRLLDALRDPESADSAILRLAGERRRFGHPMTLLSRSIRGQFAVEGPLRFMAASALM